MEKLRKIFDYVTLKYGVNQISHGLCQVIYHTLQTFKKGVSQSTYLSVKGRCPFLLFWNVMTLSHSVAISLKMRTDEIFCRLTCCKWTLIRNVIPVSFDSVNHSIKRRRTTSCREEETGQILNWNNSLHQGEEHEKHVYTAECFKYECVQTSFTRSTSM